MIPLSEKELQNTCVDMALLYGWEFWHDQDSRKNRRGLPDLILIHPTGRLMWRELKSATGKLRPDQERWLKMLEKADQDVAVWRPEDLHSGRIQRELQGRT